MDDVRKHELRQLVDEAIRRTQSGQDFVTPEALWLAGDNKTVPLTLNELRELLDE
jgi:hypothetical protein